MPVHVFVAVRNVQKEVFFVMFLVERSHGRAGRRDYVIYEEEQRILGAKMDSLADQEVELTDGEVRGYQELLLVQVADFRFRRLLNYYRHSIRIFPPYLLSLHFPPLEGVHLLVAELHGDVSLARFSHLPRGRETVAGPLETWRPAALPLRDRDPTARG